MKKIIEQPDVQFILTGGTIDSYYDATKDTAVPNRHSVIPEYIKSLKINNKVIFTQVCMKDSRSLTQNDRKKILETIEKSVSKKIIITHGTYTMPDTAKYLQANLKRKKRGLSLLDQGFLSKAFHLPMQDLI
ncbi:MAG: asparaginase domain-containing protein [Candidatus Gracilibacteria bacterium]